jgi:arylformamidase
MAHGGREETMTGTDLRGYSPEEFERQFNPRAAVPNHQPKIDARKALSAEVRAQIDGHFDVRYGPNPNELLDIYPAAGGGPAPVQLYIHGGYWRAQDKSDVAFIARPFTSAGATTVIINYDLCPSVGLDEIVAETIRAIAWTWQNIGQYGGDPDRIFVSGNSAGGHLCAMALAHDWAADGLPDDIIKGAAPSTGVYDVEPVLGISVNADVRLTPDMVGRLAPLNHPPRRALPLIISVGGAETEAWIKQSRDYLALCRARGMDPVYIEVPGADHFDMTGAMGQPDQPLLPAILRQMGLDPTRAQT